MQQVDEAVPVLASMDKDQNFRKAVSSLKAVHPPRNAGNKILPANMLKPKQEAAPVQTVIVLLSLLLASDIQLHQHQNS